jgi:N-acetylmuramoyl-L-alanine amidase CwlA
MVELEQKLLTPNKYSRPQTALHKIKGLIMHWVANPQTSAEFNRNYFEMRKNGKLGYGSAHLIVGLTGEIIQCIPLDEVAHHAGPTSKTTDEAKKVFGDYPNGCLLGIETCHMDWDGHYTEETLRSAIKLCAWLCQQFDLTEYDIYTHHFVTGKDCPKWFVNNPDEWVRFINEVEAIR